MRSPPPPPPHGVEIIDLTQDSDTEDEDGMEMDDEVVIIDLQGDDGDEDMDVEQAVEGIHGDDEEGREDVAVQHAGLKWSEWLLLSLRPGLIHDQSIPRPSHKGYYPIPSPIPHTVCMALSLQPPN